MERSAEPIPEVDPSLPLPPTAAYSESMDTPVEDPNKSTKQQMNGSAQSSSSVQTFTGQAEDPEQFGEGFGGEGGQDKTGAENMSGIEKLRNHLLKKRVELSDDQDTTQAGDSFCEYCKGSMRKRRLCSPMQRFCSKSCAKSFRKPKQLRGEEALLAQASAEDESFDTSEPKAKERKLDKTPSESANDSPAPMVEEIDSDGSDRDEQESDNTQSESCEEGTSVRNKQPRAKTNPVPERVVSENDPEVMKYLQSLKVLAAPTASLPSPTFSVPGLRPGMKLEVIDRHNPPSYCVASVIKVLGHRVCIRYDGYGNDCGNDIWCKFQAEELHPIGWCAENGYPLQPPKAITSSLEDWRTFLTKTLTGALAAPSDLFRKYKEVFQPKVHGFQLGMKLEAIHPYKPSVICPATVTKILGPFYFAVTTDFVTDLPSVTFCCHSDTPNILPVGWCFKNGVELAFPAAYNKKTFTWEKYLTTSRAAPAPGHLFKRVKAHKLKPGMKVETVDLESPEVIGVATIVNVMGRILKLHFDGRSGFQFMDSDSADIFPVGWCAETGHPLHTPFGKIQPPASAAVMLELKTSLMSFAEVMGKKAAPASATITTSKSSRASEKTEVKRETGEDVEDEGSDISDDETYSGSERFFHNKNQIFFNKTCCIGPLLDPEEVAKLPDATPRGKVSTVIRTGLEMVAKCAFHPEKVIELMQAGCGVRVVVKHQGKILKKAISRVDSRPKLERYLKRFCRHLICCEYFLSLKPVSNPCPDNCKADGLGNLLGPKGLKARRSREYFEVKHLGYEKRKRGRKRKIALEGLTGSSHTLHPSVGGREVQNGGRVEDHVASTMLSATQLKTERQSPSTCTISSKAPTLAPTISCESSSDSRAVSIQSVVNPRPVLPVPPVTRTITMPLVSKTSLGVNNNPNMTVVMRPSAPPGMAVATMVRPSLDQPGNVSVIPPPPPLRSSAESSLVTNISSQRFFATSNDKMTTITFGSNPDPTPAKTQTVYHRPGVVPSVSVSPLPPGRPDLTRPPPPYNPKNIHMYLPPHSNSTPIRGLVHNPHTQQPLPAGSIKQTIIHHHPTTPPPPPLTPLSGKPQYSPVATSPRQSFPPMGSPTARQTIELSSVPLLPPHSLPHSMAGVPRPLSASVARVPKVPSPNVQVVSGTPVPLTRTITNTHSPRGPFRGTVYLQGRPGRPVKHQISPFSPHAGAHNGMMSAFSFTEATEVPVVSSTPVPGQPGYRVQSIKYFGRNTSTQAVATSGSPAASAEPRPLDASERKPVGAEEASTQKLDEDQLVSGDISSATDKGKPSMWWLKRKRRRRHKFTVVKKRKESDGLPSQDSPDDKLPVMELISSAGMDSLPSIMTRRRGRPPKKLPLEGMAVHEAEVRRGPSSRSMSSPGVTYSKINGLSSSPMHTIRSTNLAMSSTPEHSRRVFAYPIKPRPPMSDASTNTTLPGCPLDVSPDLPTDPSTWTVDQVVTYIQSTDVQHYADIFKEQEMDGSSLMLVTQKFLMQFTKIKLGPILKVCSYINQLRLRVRPMNKPTI